MYIRKVSRRHTAGCCFFYRHYYTTAAGGCQGFCGNPTEIRKFI
ncbi:hypothetical protein SUBVAR_06442 [Subdoligranulum variabile DSM 15176]|uniref:Uncharacterized protein n=1 Tax=Subdoligranulum variabile DSM 15176 TaxID=411471 RepID=D1PPX5_9FIRM|nr:hypothetical protein SUBVAR_06442 [Subdoligranulum variabile DSM 15176]